MSEVITSVVDFPVNINITESPVIDIEVNLAGIQGPEGPIGIPGTGQGTTGNFYPLYSNPSGYVKSGELFSASGQLQSNINNLSGQTIKYKSFLTSGRETELIQYPSILSNNPSSICYSFENNRDYIIYSLNHSGVNRTGFYINYSDYLSNSGYILNVDLIV